ncbi:MAG: L-seryl-tRNA(Ser) seleniumtransferase [Actinomycetota bacterium]|nr:L-seryl-tRNA(Ser) seleniumtransferase [Actinomycetota bacterium]
MPVLRRVRLVDPRRGLPSVERVLRALGDDLPHGIRARCARDAVDAAREQATSGVPTTFDGVVADARGRLDAARRGLLAPLVNATGVLLHTNLGRAPLGDAALDAVRDIAAYSNLEYDLETGERGSRHAHAGHLLATACGAEAGLVVNNNAAAVLLTLAALAREREVIVSRGELVEIGGAFRVPDIMREAGARLVEVGTTNRTRLADYASAVSVDTAVVLKVHASNYRMVGFVEQTPVDQLAGLDAPVVVDSGSGLLDETTPWLPHRPSWLRDELGVRQCVEAGAALVTFSGDKLLGGPQAGVVVGRADLVRVLARHPLARAVRADKLTLAALQSVALTYLSGDATSLPLWRMATVSIESLRARAERLAARVAGAKIVDTTAAAGAGSLPGLDIPSVGIALDAADVEHALSELRVARIIALVREGRIVCDLRTIDERDDERVATALGALR